MFPNGMCGTPGVRPAEWGKILGDSPGFDASGVLATVAQEVLLRSSNGRLQVFPAMPKGWCGEFTLAAEGGFVVSSSVNDQGEVEGISVLSRRGGPCLIANPWKNEAVLKPQSREPHRFAGDIAFETVAGGRYGISPAVPIAASAPIAVARNTGPKWAVHLSDVDTAEAYLDRLPMFGFIGMTADGRNPARMQVTGALNATAKAKAE